MKKKIELMLIKAESNLQRYEETHHLAYLTKEWAILNAHRQTTAEILLMFPNVKHKVKIQLITDPTL